MDEAWGYCGSTKSTGYAIAFGSLLSLGSAEVTERSDQLLVFVVPLGAVLRHSLAIKV